MINLNTKHDALVQAIIALLIGSFIVTGCFYTEKPYKSHHETSEGILRANLSQHGRYLLLIRQKQAMDLIDLVNHQRIHRWQHSEQQPQAIVSTAICPGNRYVLTAEERNIALWDIKTGKRLSYTTPSAGIEQVAVLPRGNKAVVALNNQTIELLDLFRHEVIRRFPHQGHITTLSITRQGDKLLSGDDEGHVVVHALNSGEVLQAYQLDQPIDLVKISPNGKYALAATTSGEVHLWHLATGKAMADLEHELVAIEQARFSDDDDLLAIGSRSQQVRIWHVPTGTPKNQWLLPENDHWSPADIHFLDMVFTKNNQYLITQDSSGYTHHWKIK